ESEHLGFRAEAILTNALETRHLREGFAISRRRWAALVERAAFLVVLPPAEFVPARSFPSPPVLRGRGAGVRGLSITRSILVIPRRLLSPSPPTPLPPEYRGERGARRENLVLNNAP